jgi:hypothetical protein
MRTMISQETVDDNDVVGGVLMTMLAEGDRPDQSFWVAEDEAEKVIRMLADTFRIDLNYLD